MHRGLSWVALAIAPALAACSLLYKSDLDDARRPSAPVADAGSDATTGPAVVAADAGVDASPASGCAAYPGSVFCDDFDAQLNIADGWDRASVGDGATVGFDTLAVSPPRSFRTSLAASPSCTYSRLEKHLTGLGTRRVTTSFRARPKAPWTGDAAILSVTYGGCTTLLVLQPDAPSISANINAQYVNGTLQNDTRDIDGAPFPDQWTDVTLDAVNADGHVKLTVSFAYESAKMDAEALDLPQCSLTGELQLAVGFHCSQDTHEVRYDDVRVFSE